MAAAAGVRRPLERRLGEEPGSQAALKKIVDVKPGLPGLEPLLGCVPRDEIAESLPAVEPPEDLRSALVHGDPVGRLLVQEVVDLPLAERVERRSVKDGLLRNVRHE
jgi:hypothetical protein